MFELTLYLPPNISTVLHALKSEFGHIVLIQLCSFRTFVFAFCVQECVHKFEVHLVCKCQACIGSSETHIRSILIHSATTHSSMSIQINRNVIFGSHLAPTLE